MIHLLTVGLLMIDRLFAHLPLKPKHYNPASARSFSKRLKGVQSLLQVRLTSGMPQRLQLRSSGIRCKASDSMKFTHYSVLLMVSTISWYVM